MVSMYDTFTPLSLPKSNEDHPDVVERPNNTSTRGNEATATASTPAIPLFTNTKAIILTMTKFVCFGAAAIVSLYSLLDVTDAYHVAFGRQRPTTTTTSSSPAYQSTALKGAVSPSSSSPSSSSNEGSSKHLFNRRSWFSNVATATAATLAAGSTLAPASPASAADTDDNDVSENVYFGVGCFWHIQHEFIEAEKKILGRNVHQYTSAAGYAGGKSADGEGRVCYHNIQFVADYGKLGHGEVVGMTLPRSKIPDFTQVYFDLYDPRTKDRVDPADRGGEYRSLIGLPGGTQHPLYSQISEIAAAAGFTLKPGQGNDPDTLHKRLVYVYDTKEFPFYQAEVYHQYHNDFQSPPYGKAYNALADLALEEGRIHTTGCPDRV